MGLSPFDVHELVRLGRWGSPFRFPHQTAHACDRLAQDRTTNCAAQRKKDGTRVRTRARPWIGAAAPVRGVGLTTFPEFRDKFPD